LEEGENAWCPKRGPEKMFSRRGERFLSSEKIKGTEKNICGRGSGDTIGRWNGSA